MKVTFVGHASILVEANGVRILSDPWWRGPCFGAQWWLFPEAHLQPVEAAPVDYIYVSHGHHDHFHPGTLGKFSRDTKILVSKHVDLAPWIRAMGFPVTEVSEQEEIELGSGVRARIIPTVNDDTLMTISDGSEVCVNLNDALHATAPEVQDRFIALLKGLHPRIDYVFCGYGTASHFPNCYLIPGKDPLRTAAKRQHYFNQAWVHIIQGLQPRFGFPFAADVVLLENELFQFNVIVHNHERPTRLFQATYPSSPIQVMDIAPGFVIENGKVVTPRLRQPLDPEALKVSHKEKIEKANTYAPATAEEIREVFRLFEENVEICRPYLETFPGDYRCLIEFRNSPEGFEVEKLGKQTRTRITPLDPAKRSAYDVIYRMRLTYLKQSFTNPYGHEILFVGSGGMFEYTDPSKMHREIHRELVAMVTKHKSTPKARYGGQNRWVYLAKQFVKRLLGREDFALYDLEQWTVFEGHS